MGTGEGGHEFMHPVAFHECGSSDDEASGAFQ